MNTEHGSIYLITNKINGRIYVGATSLPFETRKYLHIMTLKWGHHRNAELNADWATMGADCFLFTEVEQVPDKAMLREREQDWTKDFEAGGVWLYNSYIDSTYRTKDGQDAPDAKLQVKVSPHTKSALEPLLKHHLAGPMINDIAPLITPDNLPSLYASERKGEKGHYATLYIVPTEETLDHAAELRVAPHRVLRAAAILLAHDIAS